VRYIQPDEPNFVDQSRVEWLYAEEEVVVSPLKGHAGAFYADAR
jgi:hypothetical protein